MKTSEQGPRIMFSIFLFHSSWGVGDVDIVVIGMVRAIRLALRYMFVTHFRPSTYSSILLQVVDYHRSQSLWFAWRCIRSQSTWSANLITTTASTLMSFAVLSFWIEQTFAINLYFVSSTLSETYLRVRITCFQIVVQYCYIGVQHTPLLSEHTI